MEIKNIKRGKQNYEAVPTLINQINDIEINPSHHIFTKKAKKCCSCYFIGISTRAQRYSHC